MLDVLASKVGDLVHVRLWVNSPHQNEKALAIFMGPDRCGSGFRAFVFLCGEKRSVPFAQIEVFNG